MTEQVQEAAGDAHAAIRRITARLTDAQLRFRDLAIERARQAGTRDSEPITGDLMRTLQLPAPGVRGDEARQEIERLHGWNENPSDYTEAGMQRQLQRVTEQAAGWYQSLRTALNGLARRGTITQADANEVLRTIVPDDALPAEPRVTVSFTITGSASALASDLPHGTTDEVITVEARRRLLDAVTDTDDEGSFAMDGNIVVHAQVTRS